MNAAHEVGGAAPAVDRLRGVTDAYDLRPGHLARDNGRNSRIGILRLVQFTARPGGV
jgi:hypothetical protein